MRKTSKIIVSVLFLAVLLIGIGYAAIQNITLNIAGIAKSDPSQSNFKVMFSGEPTVSDEEYVTAAITDDINSTINVEGLTEKGQTVNATYTVQNVSTDISADLAVSTTNSNTEYFTISSRLEKTSLVVGEATTLTVTVELTKIPITESVSSAIGVQLVAMPVEPGQEGTSEGIKGSSQTPATTLSKVTNDNIGDYIDLGNNIIGTESTSDDWRIFYKEDDIVYVILADYLPGNKVPEMESFTTELKLYPYSVLLRDMSNVFVNDLLNETVWNGFTNGISEAKSIGAPTMKLLISSYNAKNGTELILDKEITQKLDINTKGYDLYVPHTEILENCEGYWLATTDNDNRFHGVMSIAYNGELKGSHWDDYCFSIRPVIELKANTICEYENDIWIVKQ